MLNFNHMPFQFSVSINDNGIEKLFSCILRKINYCCLDSLEDLLCVSEMCESIVVVCKKDINVLVLCIDTSVTRNQKYEN